MLDWSTGLSDLLMKLGLPESWALGIAYFVGATVLAAAAPTIALALDLDHTQGHQPHPRPHRAEPPGTVGSLPDGGRRGQADVQRGHHAPERRSGRL